MTDVVIDYETYYDDTVSVVNLGNLNYVKATDAYIVSLTVPGEGIKCGTIEEMRQICDNICADRTVRPVAANSNFDQAWWEKYHKPFEKQWHCVLDHSVYHQYPRNLAGACGAATGVKVDKTARDNMKGVTYESLTPAEQEAMQIYCANDVQVEYELLQTLPPMSAFEEKVAAHTRMINRRGVAINIDLVEADKTKLEAMQFEALKAIPWHKDSPALSHPALVRYCNTNSLPVPKSTAKTNEDTTALMTDCPELKVVIDTLRRFRRANTMLRKVENLVERVTPEGLLPLDLLYCGAPHTRRWSSKGFNIQNLDKEPLIISPEIGSVWSRSWVIPRPGKIFYIPDFAQIEPRCLNWLVNNEEMMAALRTGFSYYEAYLIGSKQAARVGWSGKAGTLKKELPVTKYTRVKNEALGCGYGMGATKYTTYAHISEEEAKEVVDGFRKSNPLIVKFWKHLDNLIITSARDKSHHLKVEMPTGDFLQHFGVRPSGRGYESFTVKGDKSFISHQPRLWGGMLTENVTQRMARDVLADAVIRLEEAGFPVIFHVHDEVIIELDDDHTKEEARKEIDNILKTAPQWAGDLPLGIEGNFEVSYTK